jgi:hypothetical protein
MKDRENTNYPKKYRQARNNEAHLFEIHGALSSSAGLIFTV